MHACMCSFIHACMYSFIKGSYTCMFLNLYTHFLCITFAVWLLIFLVLRVYACTCIAAHCLYNYMIQIDNHLLFTSNPIILFAYPTPPTIASKYGKHAIHMQYTCMQACTLPFPSCTYNIEPKPFIQSSLILKNSSQTTIKQVQ